ncbi:hypothetical protein Tco_1209432 [Tanacetum coccineum]
MTLLLRIITVPPLIGNFNISCAVDGNLAYRQMVSPLNPMSDVVAGIIWLLISGRSLMKQCSVRTYLGRSSTTISRVRSALHFASRIIVLPFHHLSPKSEKRLTVSRENSVTFLGYHLPRLNHQDG